MAFMDPSEAQVLREKLTTDLPQLGKLFNSKKSPYQHKNVEHNLVEDMIKDGWEEYGTPLKTKTRMRKAKSHDIKFEDDIWCQLYKLGFRQLNYSRDFKLPYGKQPEDKKQIDVIAINDDTILLVECKSSAKPSKAPSFKTEFEGLKPKLDGFSKSLEQLFSKGRKIKYIFATRNLRLDRESVDIKRLLATDSFFYNDNTYEYVDGLIKAYKDAAHYQFLALLFKGKDINKDKIEVPALEGKMGGKTYYMFSLEPHLLLKMGFVLHRTKANEAEMPTYQRLLVPSRLTGIGKFIDAGGFFPNSIVLNFNDQESRLEFQANARGNSSRSRYGTLKIPNAYATAYIIDGQHRLYGYAQSEYKESNTIPVVAFYGLNSTEQLELFMEINENQKAVSPTLRITLEEDLFWDADRTDSRMKALRSSIIRELGEANIGPLHNKISIGEDRAKLAAKPFATAIARCGLLPQARGNSYIAESTKASLYDTHKHDHDSEMRKAKNRTVRFINLCYQFVEENFSDIYESENSYILSNRGTFAFISTIGSLNTYLTEQHALTPKTDIEKRFKFIEKYLNALIVQLKSLPKERKDIMFGKLGTGAENLWFRTFQDLINNKFKDFEPIELLDWRERQDQELQDEGRILGTNTEKFLKKVVLEKLKYLFDDNWELEIGAIQRDCATRAREQMEKNYKEGLKTKEIFWTDQFYITDYKKIIEKYWSKKPSVEDPDFQSFADVFSIDVDMGFNSKSDKLKWLSIFNSYRNSWAHEGTKEKGLNREEVRFLQLVHDHFYG